MSKISEMVNRLGSLGVLINKIFAGLIKPSAIESAVNGLSASDFKSLFDACQKRAEREAH